MPSCPICGSRMQFKDKKNYGFNFWGCINYPSCKGIRKEN
ncbi:topoisomerase DNA-binding C4 zinc finger domain-containing protein [Acinetobacter indicus]